MISDANLALIGGRFPHIRTPLEILWGAPEVATRIEKILADTRGGQRKGFPPDVLDALMDIHAMHAELRKSTQQDPLAHWAVPEKHSPWDDVDVPL